MSNSIFSIIMSTESNRKDEIEKWLKSDEWDLNKDGIVSSETKYTVTLKNNQKFQLLLASKVDKITLSYKYILSSELQNFPESLILDFIYNLRVELLLMNIYLKYDSITKTMELKNFIFWEDCIRNMLLHSMYKMEQVIDLCEIKDKIFVKNH